MTTTPSAINVTKSYLPPQEEYQQYLARIWKSGQLTNQGPLLKEFESEMRAYLHVENFHFVTNGTLALQLALKSLGADSGEIITTPFTYVATVSSILWEGFNPVFVDIDPKTLCMDPSKIEQAVTSKTRAIMPVHVFGHPCDVEAIEAIAKRHGLMVIYDSAHAFGAQYKGKPLLSYGDISIGSFHATKPFHTIEGGCVIVKDKKISDKVELMKRFGHHRDEHLMLGINAKASEFQAAMGLCNLKHIDEIIEGRKRVLELYDSLLDAGVKRPIISPGTDPNYAYYPVILENEKQLLGVVKRLNSQNIFPRRYFYPSLNTLPYLKDSSICPVSEDISNRILCLPLYVGLAEETVKKICGIVNK